MAISKSPSSNESWPFGETLRFLRWRNRQIPTKGPASLESGDSFVGIWRKTPKSQFSNKGYEGNGLKYNRLDKECVVVVQGLGSKEQL